MVIRIGGGSQAQEDEEHDSCKHFSFQRVTQRSGWCKQLIVHLALPEDAAAFIGVYINSGQ